MMSDKFSLPGCSSCGYYSSREQSCGLILEYREIFCPFYYSLADFVLESLSREELEGGDG